MKHRTNETWHAGRLIAVLALALSGCVVAPVDPYGYSYSEEVYLAPSPQPVYRSYAPAPGYGRTYAPAPGYGRAYAPAPGYRWIDDDRRSDRDRIDHRHDRDRGHWAPPPNHGKPPERDRQRERDHDRAKERERDRDRDRAADRDRGNDRGNQTQTRREQQRMGDEIARRMRERVGPAEHETLNTPGRQLGVRDPGDRAGWDRRGGDRSDGRKYPRDR